MNTKTMFSSDKMDWGTPQDLFDKLDEEFHFTLDPCASYSNAKCKKYYTKEDDGLSKDWTNEIVFVNPPYGSELKEWIKKSYEESLDGTTVVCLIASRTCTKVWHNYVMKAKEIRFIKGRVKFVGGSNTAPFPSAIVVFKPGESTLKVTSYIYK